MGGEKHRKNEQAEFHGAVYGKHVCNLKKISESVRPRLLCADKGAKSMSADPETYLLPLADELRRVWPDNRTVNIVCHGHSIPAGYTANHMVRPFDAYPHQLHRALNERYPCAVVNVIVTAIGGENSASGSRRFERDALCHRPRLVTIDYAGNDRFIRYDEAAEAWRHMIEASLKAGAKVILMTPSPDCGQLYYNPGELRTQLFDIVRMIRSLADEYEVGLADVAAAFERLMAAGHVPADYLTNYVHPNRAAHKVIAQLLMRWFPFNM